MFAKNEKNGSRGAKNKLQEALIKQSPKRRHEAGVNLLYNFTYCGQNNTMVPQKWTPPVVFQLQMSKICSNYISSTKHLLPSDNKSGLKHCTHTGVFIQENTRAGTQN